MLDYFCIIRINESTNNGVIIPTLEVIHSDFSVVIVATITERVDSCDRTTGRVRNYGRYAPRVVGVSRDSFCILIDDGDNIALKILCKIIVTAVVVDAADAVINTVEREERIAAPDLADDLRSVERVVCLTPPTVLVILMPLAL